MSLAGESSSASASDRGSLAAGVRGLSGAITMERSEHEKLKYPDRINLDRKGLHGKMMLIRLLDIPWIIKNIFMVTLKLYQHFIFQPFQFWQMSLA